MMKIYYVIWKITLHLQHEILAGFISRLNSAV